MDEGVKYYFEKMDKHRKTSKFFWLIPFNFRIVKEEAIFLLFTLSIVIGFATDLLLLTVPLFFLFSTEYSRIYDYRKEILGESLMNEEMFKIGLLRDGIDPEFPDDPLYVTEEDRDQFFSESLSSIRSYHLFMKILLFVKVRYIHRR